MTGERSRFRFLAPPGGTARTRRGRGGGIARPRGRRGERPDRGGGGAGRKDGKRRDRADTEGRKKKETLQLHAAGSP